MQKMKGYRTLIANLVMFLVAAAAMWGFDIPVEDSDGVVVGSVAVVNIVNMFLRFITTTPVGEG